LGQAIDDGTLESDGKCRAGNEGTQRRYGRSIPDNCGSSYVYFMPGRRFVRGIAAGAFKGLINEQQCFHQGFDA
jgi:hypothetical protein